MVPKLGNCREGAFSHPWAGASIAPGYTPDAFAGERPGIPAPEGEGRTDSGTADRPVFRPVSRNKQRASLFLASQIERANGEEIIRKRKDGRWEGRYTAGCDPVTGKAVYKNVPGNIPPEKLTAMDFHRLYKHPLESGRVERTESDNKPKGLSVKTLRNINQMISSALNCAVEQKLIPSNPTKGCVLPKLERKEMKILPPESLGAFFEEARRGGVFELYYIDLTTGLWRGELLGLKWSGIDLSKGIVRVRRQILRQNGKVVEAPTENEKLLPQHCDRSGCRRSP